MTAESAGQKVASGYEILQVYAVEQHYEVVTDAPSDEGTADDSESVDPPLGVNWDWRVLHDRDFEVQFGIELPPTAEFHELIRVRFVLRARAGEELSLPPVDFVGGPAISLLLPYIREAVSSMSVRGPLGVRYINPLNARALAEQFSFDESMGAKQLSENPALSEIYRPESGSHDGASPASD